MLMSAHPVRIVNQRADRLFIQSAGGTEINIFDAGRTLQPALSQPPLERSILTPVPLSVHQQRETFFEGELRGVGIFLLLGESIGHATQTHGVQLLDGLLIEHGSPSDWTY
jgi:hypothetical protein